MDMTRSKKKNVAAVMELATGRDKKREERGVAQPIGDFNFELPQQHETRRKKTSPRDAPPADDFVELLKGGKEKGN